LLAEGHSGSQHRLRDCQDLKSALEDLFYGLAKQAQLLDLVRVGAEPIADAREGPAQARLASTVMRRWETSLTT
jgi:hypothetical protein